MFQAQLLHETVLQVSFYFTTILKNIFEQFIYFTTCNSEQKHIFLQRNTQKTSRLIQGSDNGYS